MKIIKKIVWVLIVVLAIFLITPLFVGNTYHTERSVEIDADKAEVYEYMSNFGNFKMWSPWAELDPSMNVEVKGKPGEIGSSYSWKGNEEVGSGIMTIQDMSENEIEIQLKFIEPFESVSTTRYIVSNLKEGTKVTWEMDGRMDYPTNSMLLFIDMDEQIGKDFDRGLQKLKSTLN
jgi:hypothetical protein